MPKLLEILGAIKETMDVRFSVYLNDLFWSPRRVPIDSFVTITGSSGATFASTAALYVSLALGPQRESVFCEISSPHLLPPYKLRNLRVRPGHVWSSELCGELSNQFPGSSNTSHVFIRVKWIEGNMKERLL